MYRLCWRAISCGCQFRGGGSPTPASPRPPFRGRGRTVVASGSVCMHPRCLPGVPPGACLVSPLSPRGASGCPHLPGMGIRVSRPLRGTPPATGLLLFYCGVVGLALGVHARPEVPPARGVHPGAALLRVHSPAYRTPPAPQSLGGVAHAGPGAVTARTRPYALHYTCAV